MINKKQEGKSGKIFDGKILIRIFAFVKPYLFHFYLLVFLTIALAALAPVRPLLTQVTVDDYILKDDFKGLTMMLGIMIAAAVLQAFVQFAHTYLSGWLGQYIIKDIRVQLYAHILKLRLQFYNKTPIGQLVTRVISDIETLSEVFTNGLAAIIGDLLQLVVIFCVMLWMDWRLTLITMTTFPFMVFFTYIFKEKIKVTYNQVRNAVSKLNTFVQEHITGMSVVQIFNSEEREYEKFKKINKEHLQANIKTVFYYSVYFPIAEIITAVSTGLLVWYGTYQVLDYRLDIGTLVAFIMFIAAFFRPLRMLADRFNTLQLGIVSSDRILKLLDDNSYVQEEGIYHPKQIMGWVEFKHVWFAYNKKDYVLKDISFQVKQGETLAFIGATGAGKSSIINLLSKFYEINSGAILLDNRDIREYTLDGLRRYIGVVFQDVFLFSNTIYNNVTLGDLSITQAQIERAAELVGAQSFIEKLPGKYDYNVMERGATLSVGQRQLLSFARAMVYDPQIIVLDEATSSVDQETEALIQHAVENVMRGRTAIVIAHRLATIQKADRIIVLDKGEIKEAGTHQELLAMNGYYTYLYNIQFKDAVS